MLYKNGDNLKEGLIDYLSNKNNITIFSPYIKSEPLTALLNSPGLKCEQIIVRWEPKDIALGASDLDIYHICKDNNISLYMNNRIHLKLFTDNFNDAFLGSANISKRAISNDTQRFNYEVCTYVDNISISDRSYLHAIINNSILIDDNIYNSIKEQIPDIDSTIYNTSFKLPKSITSNTDFLISKLPMLESPDLFWKLYSGESSAETMEEKNCYCHDLSLYKINTPDFNKNEFFNLLSSNFFNLPFIFSFLKEVDNSSRKTKYGQLREGLQFGAVKRWFANHTTSVPSPRPFELTKNVQILYCWIEHLSNGQYSVFTPGAHSQVIKRTSTHL